MRFNFTRGRIRSTTFLSTMHRCACVSIVQLCERSAPCTPSGFRMEFKSGWYAILTNTKQPFLLSPHFFNRPFFPFPPFSSFFPTTRLFNLGYEIESHSSRRHSRSGFNRATTTKTIRFSDHFYFTKV